MFKSHKIDLLALIVSLFALGISALQLRDSARATAISVMPAIDIVLIRGQGSSTKSGFKIDNAGNGPAEVVSFELFVDGVEVEAATNLLWSNALTQIGFSEARKSELRYIYYPPGVMLSAGYEGFALSPPNIGGNLGEFTLEEGNMLARISIKIVYKALSGKQCSTKFSPSEPESPYKITRCI